MRPFSIAISLLFFLFAAITSFAADEPAAKVALLPQHEGQRQLNAAEQATLRGLAMDLVKSSNFNTVDHPEILKLSVPAVHERYRRLVAGDCLVVTFDQPVTVQTLGGEMAVFEIIVGLGESNFVHTLFTIDRDGRVVGHGKYSGTILLELRKAAASGSR